MAIITHYRRSIGALNIFLNDNILGWYKLKRNKYRSVGLEYS